MMTQSPGQRDSLPEPGSRIFFVGIGGISMFGLAQIARGIGFSAAGSDMHPSARTDELAAAGIRFFSGHSADWIDAFKPDLVVYSSAVLPNNPELARAASLGIRTVVRADFLGWLNKTFGRVINIAGTHGKTTTTAMCALILIESGVDPTVHLGAELEQFQGTIRLGRPGGVMVSEADEYMRSFLKFHQTTAAILNIDYDHVDCYSSIDDVIDAFVAFAGRLPDGGRLVVPAFDSHVARMLDLLREKRRDVGRPMPCVVYFGSATDCVSGHSPDFNYQNLVFENGYPQFDVFRDDRFYCRLSLAVPGIHNVRNALAAIACACEDGGTPEAGENVLNHFRGAEGRFTRAGEYRGATVISDYAHHPSAVRMTLAAAANLHYPRTWVVFQPLTFSRTRVLLDDFASSLKDCEFVILSEIFSDREINPGDISSSHLAGRINDMGGQAVFAPSFDDIRAHLEQKIRPGDLVLVLGPENIREFADQLTGRKRSARGT